MNRSAILATEAGFTKNSMELEEKTYAMLQ